MRLARLVERVPGAWIIKGGYALQLRLGDAARMTKDIDANVHRIPEGRWRLWYKDATHSSRIYAADSTHLYHGKVAGPAITGFPPTEACAAQCGLPRSRGGPQERRCRRLRLEPERHVDLRNHLHRLSIEERRLIPPASHSFQRSFNQKRMAAHYL